MIRDEKLKDKYEDRVVAMLNKLDKTIEKLDKLGLDNKKHSILTALYTRKVNHEIKKIYYDAGKYDSFEEEEFNDYLKSLQDIYPEYNLDESYWDI